jgi:hypothetical protein
MRQPIKPPERFEAVERSGDLLDFRVAGIPRLAKASLSRLLQQFQNKVDFVILTCYRDKVPEQENSNAFHKFPAEYRSLVGTYKIGAFELVGHWQEEGGEEELERSWFFTNGDPNLSGEKFIAVAKALAGQYLQTAMVISRQGVTTLESPEGTVYNTLTTAAAIENDVLKLRTARDVPDAPDADQGIAKEGGNAYRIQPCIFVGVPGNLSAKRVFSIWGMNYPKWPILEK